MKQKLTAIILLLSLLTPALIGCSETTENAQEESAPQTTETVQAPTADAETEPSADDPDVELVTDDLPDRDFGGFSYNIYTRSNTTHYQLLAEEMNGEVLNDAIYDRNLKVADRFNVVFSETIYSDEGLAATNVRSGDQTFSLMNVRATAADNMAQNKLCYDISSSSTSTSRSPTGTRSSPTASASATRNTPPSAPPTSPRSTSWQSCSSTRTCTSSTSSKTSMRSSARASGRSINSAKCRKLSFSTSTAMA